MPASRSKDGYNCAVIVSYRLWVVNRIFARLERKDASFVGRVRKARPSQQTRMVGRRANVPSIPVYSSDTGLILATLGAIARQPTVSDGWRRYHFHRMITRAYSRAKTSSPGPNRDSHQPGHRHSRSRRPGRRDLAPAGSPPGARDANAATSGGSPQCGAKKGILPECTCR